MSLASFPFSSYFPYTSPPFQRAALSILLAPLIWNILARCCRRVTKGKGPSFRYGVCYALALWIFSFSSLRDYLFKKAVEAHPEPLLLPSSLYKSPFFSHLPLPPSLLSSLFHFYIPLVLFVFGQLLVWSSFLRLGITGTFLGDYCGIYMKERVRGFPFSLLDNPMYVGSTLCFVASSLYFNSAVGMVLTAEIAIIYWIALRFEGPYTEMIYREREQEKQGSKKVK